MLILNDFSTSVHKALSEIDSDYLDYPGVVVCGTHNPHDTEALIHAIKLSREQEKPFLGICFGHQLAYIEYCRNVLGIKDATSEEFGQGTLVVVKRPELKVGLHEGETWWNNYEIPKELEQTWDKPEYFITTQAHPEYQSSRDKPHPLLVNFLNLCRGKSE